MLNRLAVIYDLCCFRVGAVVNFPPGVRKQPPGLDKDGVVEKGCVCVKVLEDGVQLTFIGVRDGSVEIKGDRGIVCVNVVNMDSFYFQLCDEIGLGSYEENNWQYRSIIFGNDLTVA